ncbi:PQQ-binding-like beta-propeller repeat protein [Haloarcula sp. JP-L23]|uniref:outer membrane protein assembly factor BamB family protein n=1 Tax=Haloarcula sp. JP-L23 TaxID=2716717 RepID=UPI0032E3D67C
MWSRRLFGTVLPNPPVWNGYAAAVATEAGEVALLTLTDGTGVQRFRLPAPPVAPPSADTDSVYVTCRDGVTYALRSETSSSGQRRWSVETGWSPGGIGLDSGLVFAGTSGELHAVDSESGSVRWTHRLGDWRHTARLSAGARCSSAVTGCGHSTHAEIGAVRLRPGGALRALVPRPRRPRTDTRRRTLYVVAETGQTRRTCSRCPDKLAVTYRHVSCRRSRLRY